MIIVPKRITISGASSGKDLIDTHLYFWSSSSFLMLFKTVQFYCFQKSKFNQRD